MTLEDTPHLGLPLPHPDNSPRTVDVPRLRAALTAIDGHLKALQEESGELHTALIGLDSAKADKTQVAIDIAEAVSRGISDLLNGAPEAYNTLKEIADKFASDDELVGGILSTLGNLSSGLSSVIGGLSDLVSEKGAPSGLATLDSNGKLNSSQVKEDVGFIEMAASGAWLKPDYCKFVYVELIGGGDGGGLSLNTGPSTAVDAGFGGMFASALFRASDLPPNVPVVIGAGGEGHEVTGNSNTTRSSSNGGDSSFHTLVARGGGGTEGIDGTYVSSVSGVVSVKGGGRSGATSIEAGDGGQNASTNNADAMATDGEYPGGAGGTANIRGLANTRTAKSGSGANGRARIWWW